MLSDSEDVFDRPFWSLSKDETIEVLETRKDGLTDAEAEDRISQFGKNSLPEKRRGEIFKILFRQFKSPLIAILVVAGVITLMIQDFKDSSFIFAAVLLNAALGFYQEKKSENALSKLKTYVKDSVRVLRNGNEIEISSKNIVPGDVIKLISGVRVPADARLIAVNDLSVDESVLTGESLPVKKGTEKVEVNSGIHSQTSMVFSGTLVSEGVGFAVVVRTGKKTELGKIASLVKGKGAGDEKTPLQLAIRKFSIRAGVILFLLSAILFLFGLAFDYEIFDMFLISVAVAVSIVPEGLPIALTVVLAVGVERLAKRKGVVKKLLAAEALGSTTVILTDKTGTLTESKMELTKIISDMHGEDVLKFALLATDVAVENPEDKIDAWRVIGKPLEAEIARASAKYKVFLPDIEKKFKVLEYKPFNSTDKFSAAVVEVGGRKHKIYLGAPDMLLEKTKAHRKEKDKFIIKLDELAYSGYRVLGLAVDNDFWGLLAFNDPVRKGVEVAIREVENAGIRTIIATGDHKGTALAVATKLGLKVSDEEILTGKDLSGMDDEDLSTRLETTKIFARVTPADKLRVTKLLQRRREVVAVTGDGVNDAPALEGADIGVAVGSGTDVAKGAADLVILDDNFETIVSAISEGRRILENIKKVIVYLLSDALDELILIGGALVLGLPLPINALQILWVNFFGDSFPAVSLAFEDEKETLRNKPSQIKKHLVDREMKFLIGIIGTISSIILFVLYVYLLRAGFDEETVRTFTFAGFSVYTLFLVFSIKSLHTSIFKYNPFGNKYLVFGVMVGFVLTLAAIYLPILQGILKTVSLPPVWLLGVFCVGIVNIMLVEFGKYLFRNR